MPLDLHAHRGRRLPAVQRKISAQEAARRISPATRTAHASGTFWRIRVSTPCAHDRGERRRAHPWIGRPGGGRYGNSHRQIVPLHGVRRHPSQNPRCRCCSTSAQITRSAARTQSISGWNHERVRGAGIRRFRRRLSSPPPSNAGPACCCNGRISRARTPGAFLGALSRPPVHVQRRYTGHRRCRRGYHHGGCGGDRRSAYGAADPLCWASAPRAAASPIC